jgi:hypothetical protein
MSKEVISFRDCIFGSPDKGISVLELTPIYASRVTKVLRSSIYTGKAPNGKAISAKSWPTDSPNRFAREPK